jgi:hypothetical protein
VPSNYEEAGLKPTPNAVETTPKPNDEEAEIEPERASAKKAEPISFRRSGRIHKMEKEAKKNHPGEDKEAKEKIEAEGEDNSFVDSPDSSSTHYGSFVWSPSKYH